MKKLKSPKHKAKMEARKKHKRAAALNLKHHQSQWAKSPEASARSKGKATSLLAMAAGIALYSRPPGPLKSPPPIDPSTKVGHKP